LDFAIAESVAKQFGGQTTNSHLCNFFAGVFLIAKIIFDVFAQDITVEPEQN
jgi:hypothetical protein